uniref:Putative secreted protein n=1 Tax=Ornithodoros turicata TaxID=34597 RepID=A0A2R5LLI2_9ACAR
MASPHVFLFALFIWSLSVPVLDASAERTEGPRPHDTEPSSPVIKPTTKSENVSDVGRPLDYMNTTTDDKSWLSITHFTTNINQPNGVIMRAFCVIAGVMLLVVIFFVVRTVRSRRRRTKTRKYGIIATRSAELELQPLDHDDDDEEETTLFDANKR